MDLHLLTTIILFLVLIIAAVRLIRKAFDPEEENRHIPHRVYSSSSTASSSSSDKPFPDPADEGYPLAEGAWKPRRSLSGTFLTLAFFAGVGYVWFYHGSLDQALKTLTPKMAPAVPVAGIAPGADHAVVDGVRWFRLVGTDSTGIGYQGWVSELAFREVPPEPSGASGTGGLLQKAGLPTPAEQVKAAKQLRKVGDQLRLQNRLNKEH